MTLYEIIMQSYPELSVADFCSPTGVIALRNDSDGVGDYIEKWEYTKPLPDGMKVGK